MFRLGDLLSAPLGICESESLVPLVWAGRDNEKYQKWPHLLKFRVCLKQPLVDSLQISDRQLVSFLNSDCRLSAEQLSQILKRNQLSGNKVECFSYYFYEWFKKSVFKIGVLRFTSQSVYQPIEFISMENLPCSYQCLT